MPGKHLVVTKDFGNQTAEIIYEIIPVYEVRRILSNGEPVGTPFLGTFSTVESAVTMFTNCNTDPYELTDIED